MSNIKNKEINELLLAINMNTKLNIQTVVTCNYRKKAKQLITKYGIEFLKRTKVFNEETQKNKYVMMVYRSEVYSSKVNLYKRLGELYQEEVKRQSDG